MLRFIYICMGVVALSVLSIAGQSLFSGLDDSYQSVLDRNNDGSAVVARSAAPDAPQIAATEPEELSAESLNEIESAAGGDSNISDPGDEFGQRFTASAPKALGDDGGTEKPVQPAALD